MTNFWAIGNQQFARTIHNDVVTWGQNAVVFSKTFEQVHTAAVEEIDKAISSLNYNTDSFESAGNEYRSFDRGRYFKFVKLDENGNRKMKKVKLEDWEKVNSKYSSGQTHKDEIDWRDLTKEEWKSALDVFLRDKRRELEHDVALRLDPIPDGAIFVEILQEIHGKQLFNRFWVIPT